MGTNDSRRPHSTSLAYSSPFVGATGVAGTDATFYNAFPDLNDLAADEWSGQSAIPQRAKYHAPLDSELIPAGRPIDAEEWNAGGAHVDEKTAALLDDVFARTPDTVIAIPRQPALRETFELQTAFEVAHKRLAPTYGKWQFRTIQLAPFYTALERALLSQQGTITVPLALDEAGSPLERRWHTLWHEFEQTRLAEEVTSLLIGVILADLDRIGEREATWVAEESGEIEGFAATYWPLRRRFRREEADDRHALAEQALAHMMREWFGEPEGGAHQWLPRPKTRGRRGPGPRLTLPDLLGHDRPGPFRVAAPVLAPASRPRSIVEVVQRALAFDVVERHHGKSYRTVHETWDDYVSFELDSDDDGAFVSGGISRGLRTAIARSIAHDEGTTLDDDTLELIARYTIFLEAMRQQACTGIGLCCPFWDGVSCCEFRPLLLHARRKMQPRSPAWGRRYWRQPPCLM